MLFDFLEKRKEKKILEMKKAILSLNKKYFMKDKNGKAISNQYYYIFQLKNDHFAVCKVFLCDSINYDENVYDMFVMFRWGIVRLQRDENGKIIPKEEEIVVPYQYDQIIMNDLKTATVCKGDKFGYVDLDIHSNSYGMELVPCLLSEAYAFNEKYFGFAECSIDFVKGFLPRNCKCLDTICESDLLTATEAVCISNYFQNKDYYFTEEMLTKYYHLTGEKIEENSLKRKK